MSRQRKPDPPSSVLDPAISSTLAPSISSSSAATSNATASSKKHRVKTKRLPARRNVDSSDEDLDPELREGIHNIMKLRDEYDKLEGALRKLGVDPDTIVGNHTNVAMASSEDDDEYEYDSSCGTSKVHYNKKSSSSNNNFSSRPPANSELDPDLCTPFNVVAVPAAGSGDTASTLTTMSLEDSLEPRTGGRLRHLDILEEVDESVLSSDNGGEDPPLPPKGPSYPWIQMALPGGGIVSVPLETATGSRGSGSVKQGPGSEHDDLSPPPGRQLMQPMQPTVASASAASSSHGGSGAMVTQADLLTVAAGEPVTHFNLDQLLEIVQSFQLDTTMATHDGQETLRSARDLSLLAASSSSNKNIPSSSGCDANQPHCDILRSSSGSKHHRDRGYRSSSSVIGCEASYNRSHRSLDIDDIQEDLAEDAPHSQPGMASHHHHQQHQEQQHHHQHQLQQQQRLETHSCPSSPTETECSSGFSTLRRRSVTLTEKIRTSKDGSKTQVVRQYGCNTSSANEPEQSVTYEKNSYVYINSGTTPGDDSNDAPEMVPLTLASEDAAASMRMQSDDPFGLQRERPMRPSALGSSSLTGGGGASSYMAGGGAGPGGGSGGGAYRSHIVRLNSLEPNTVMFSTKDYPILSDVSVPEIIDELEKQFDDKLCELQGVRLVGSNVYICLSRKDSLNYLSTYGFYVRGVPIKVVDITHDSVVIVLTGVPHYITDSTITMLVSTFGIAIGEVERRFYKGVDTGERYVRLKPRAHTQVPDFVTVGGCKILIRVLNNEEICPPYTLQSQEKEHRGPNDTNSTTVVTSSSIGGGATATGTTSSLTTLLDHQAFNSQTTASFANSSIVTSSVTGPAVACGFTSNFRAKPGHCNGTLNSPTGSATLPSLTTLSPVPRATDLLLTGITEHSESHSPKIAKSFRSRLGLRSPTKEENEHQRSAGAGLGGGGVVGHDEVDDSSRTYIPGDPINDIPSLSPPPYKGPGSTGGSSTTSNSGADRGRSGITGLGLLNRIRGSSDADDFKNNTLSRKFNRHLTKTDSSNSIGSGGQNNKNSDHAKVNGASGCNGNNKPRSSVVFEEPLKTTTCSGNSSSSTMPPPPSAAQVGRVTNRTVNGILRKGSVPGDDIVTPPNLDKDHPDGKEANRKKDSSSSNRKAKNSSSGSGKNKKSAKLESVTESGMEDGDSSAAGTKDRSSRSRSSSSKTSSKADKAAKDLALTRDLPWCGCWGNGCL